jgi:hypothetical protein
MRGTLEANPAALPRITVPSHVDFVSDATAARSALLSLNPATSAVVEASPRPLAQESVDLAILEYHEDSYRIRYTAARDALIRIAIPYAPGWKANIDRRPLELLATDYALSGVVVPAGQHELVLEFRPSTFRPGVALSLAGALIVLLMLFWPSRSLDQVR